MKISGNSRIGLVGLKYFTGGPGRSRNGIIDLGTTLAEEQIFAALGGDQQIERIAGGYETDVYRTADHRYVFKLKHDSGTLGEMRAWAHSMRTAANLFTAYLGPEHSIANDYLVVSDDTGKSYVMSVQPYIRHARPLDALDYTALAPATQATIRRQLRDIVQRSLICYRETGYLPDLYGLPTMEPHERSQRADPRWLLRQGWRLLSRSPLFTAHNLLFTPEQRIVLVDYDLICRYWITCRLYYAARRALLWRDGLHLQLLDGR